MRCMKQLKVEMGVLTKDTKIDSSRPSEEPKEFVMRCIWCDDPNHKRGDCGLYVDAIKSGIVTFKEGRIRDATTDEPLETNFGRGGMRKLMDERLGRNNVSRGKEAESFKIGVENKMEMTTNVSREAMVMVEALDTPVTKEDDEFGRMFALRSDNMGSNDTINEGEVISLKSNKEKENTNESETNEAEMVNALDTHMTEDEEVEIGEVFTIMNDP